MAHTQIQSLEFHRTATAKEPLKLGVQNLNEFSAKEEESGKLSHYGLRAW